MEKNPNKVPFSSQDYRQIQSCLDIMRVFSPQQSETPGCQRPFDILVLLCILIGTCSD